MTHDVKLLLLTPPPAAMLLHSRQTLCQPTMVATKHAYMKMPCRTAYSLRMFCCCHLLLLMLVLVSPPCGHLTACVTLMLLMLLSPPDAIAKPLVL
jgi:hypothetical protein